MSLHPKQLKEPVQETVKEPRERTSSGCLLLISEDLCGLRNHVQPVLPTLVLT